MNELDNKVVLKVRGLTKRFHEGRIDLTVLHGVDLDVHAGETLAIVGSSGSGKSTLLHLMGGLDAPTAGSVELLGQDIAQVDAAAQGRLRNQHLGFVYQFHHLLGEFSALENAAMPLLIGGTPVKAASTKAAAMLERVGLGHRLDHKPSELSGGERQRVAIARALVNEPKLVLADEPTGNLDHKSADSIYSLMCELNAQLGTAFVVVTHDRALAAKLHRRISLVDGLVAEES